MKIVFAIFLSLGISLAALADRSAFLPTYQEPPGQWTVHDCKPKLKPDRFNTFGEARIKPGTLHYGEAESWLRETGYHVRAVRGALDVEFILPEKGVVYRGQAEIQNGKFELNKPGYGAGTSDSIIGGIGFPQSPETQYSSVAVNFLWSSFGGDYREIWFNYDHLNFLAECKFAKVPGQPIKDRRIRFNLSEPVSAGSYTKLDQLEIVVDPSRLMEDGASKPYVIQLAMMGRDDSLGRFGSYRGSIRQLSVEKEEGRQFLKIWIGTVPVSEIRIYLDTGEVFVRVAWFDGGSKLWPVGKASGI